jgi:hypothetical protein
VNGKDKGWMFFTINRLEKKEKRFWFRLGASGSRATSIEASAGRYWKRSTV